MKVKRLEHYNIRTTKYAETVKFYGDVLGMKPLHAPMATKEGPPTWIYDASGTPSIHLIPVDPADPAGSYAKTVSKFRGSEPNVCFEGSGAIDHIAFECEGLDEIKARLTSVKLKFVENSIPSANLHQVFVKDPNGVTLELNFR